MNWSYQRTKACTVLVGENTDTKLATIEANKTSTSSSSSSSGTGGRTRQQSSSGGMNQLDIILDSVYHYSRKRRDTVNQHVRVLHQKITASNPPVRDNEITTRGDYSDHDNSHDVINIPQVGVHESNDKPMPLVHRNEEITESSTGLTGNELLHSSSTSSSSSYDFPSSVSMSHSSVTNPTYEYYSNTEKLLEVEHVTKSSNSEIPEEQLIKKFNKITEGDKNSQVSIMFSQQEIEIATKKSVHVASSEFNLNSSPKYILKDEEIYEKNTKAPVSSEIVEKIDEIPSVNGDENLETVTPEFGDETTKAPVNSKNNFSNNREENLKSLIAVLDESTKASERLEDNMNNLTSFLDNTTEEPEDFTTEPSTPHYLEFIDPKPLLDLENSSSSVLKITREFPADDPLSESLDIIPPMLHENSLIPEEPQHDYPHPIYNREEIEIIKLNEEKSTTISKSKTIYTKMNSNDSNDVRTLEISENLPEKKILEPLRLQELRKSSDEEFLREFDKRFRGRKHKISPPPPPKISPNIRKTEETVKNFSSSLGSNKTMTISQAPLTQHIQVVQSVPNNPSLPEKRQEFPRVTVNLTISTDDSNSSSRSKPIYVLSVSVPGGSSVDSSSNLKLPEINIGPAQLQDSRIHSENLTSSSRHSLPYEMIEAPLPPPPQPPASPPPIWGGGECECSCPCMESSSDEWDNFSTNDERDMIDQELMDIEPSLLTYQNDLFERKTEDKIQGQGTTTTEEGFLGNFTEDISSLSVDDFSEGTEPTTSMSLEGESSMTEGSLCLGVTQIPPEHTILILEGEVEVLAFLVFFNYL